MGAGESIEDLSSRITQQEQNHRQGWEVEKAALSTLDQRTRVPHLLIELRNQGFVEVQGKDTGGIYAKLAAWLQKVWNMDVLTEDIVISGTEESCCSATATFEVDHLQEHNRLCDASFCAARPANFSSSRAELTNGIFKQRGLAGESNMGLLTMQLANFMSLECGWTLQLCDGGNLGVGGSIREQQVKFKAPHPLNLIAPLIMIELRQVGYIEVNGPDSKGVHDSLRQWLREKWRAEEVEADQDYCQLKFSTEALKFRGSEGENNMGQCTMQLVDFMVKQCAWTMVTCNASNFGLDGAMREQQLVFRNDVHVQHGLQHVMVELRSNDCFQGRGYIEVNGLDDAGDLGEKLDGFLKGPWECKDYKPYFFEDSYEAFCDKKYRVPKRFFVRSEASLLNNLGKRTLELSRFLAEQGWALSLCNGGSLTSSFGNLPNHHWRELQVKFTKAPELAKAPLLLVELRIEPKSHRPPIELQGHVEISGPNVKGVYEKLRDFVQTHMQGQQLATPCYCDALHSVACFRMKEATVRPEHKSVTIVNSQCRAGGNRWAMENRLCGESNLGRWAMRLCDFMVDHVGEWDLVVCNGDNLCLNFGPHGLCKASEWDLHSPHGVTAREMQLIFRQRPAARDVFMSKEEVAPLGRPPLQAPRYWSQEAKLGQVGQHLLPASQEELQWLQELLSNSYKAVSTRDRRAPLAERFEVVQALRSEQPELWEKFARRRQELKESCEAKGIHEEDLLMPRTMASCPGLASRCRHRSCGNPAGMAYLLHGSNPTMAQSILRSSFKVDFAGQTAGTMFGPGIYLAESSSKSDEYASDDSGGEYAGLFAVLVCAVVLGRPVVTEQAGDYAAKVTSGEYDVVVGDREKAVGTFREFVLFHEASVYPEYAVFYRRVFAEVASAPAPCTMAPAAVAPAAGATALASWAFTADHAGEQPSEI